MPKKRSPRAKSKKTTSESQAVDDLLNLPFDHFERHALTRQIVDIVRESTGRETLRVLDVGGGPASLSRFLPKDYVVTVDSDDADVPATESRTDSFVHADGTRLPFADGTFDLVVSHDTLEHVPSHLRTPFVQELMRVAGDALVINGPFATRDIAAAEALVMDVARETMGDGHPTVRYLSEHAEHGLPDLQQTVSEIEAAGFAPLVVPNGALNEWVSKMLVKHHSQRMASHGVDAQELDRWSNSGYAPVAEPEPTYRHALVVSKQPGSALADTLKSRLCPTTGHAPAQASLALSSIAVRDVVRQLEAIASVTLSDKDLHAANLERTIVALRRNLGKQDERLTTLNERATTLEGELRRTTAALYTSQEQMNTVVSTFGFRAVEKLRQGIDWIAPHGSRRRLPFMATGRAGRIVLSEGCRSLLSKSTRVRSWAPTFEQATAIDPSTTPLNQQYLAWLEEHSPTPSRLRGMKKRLRSLAVQPTFSILMPTYNTKASWLQDAIESVKNQVYESWELCIVDDGSTKEETKKLLRKYEDDARIKVRYLKENSGISAASNEALAMASGEFVGLLDHDDELRADALYWVVRKLNEQEDLDFIYTDEDKKDLDGVRGEAFFKPDWSPDLEMSVNYVTHFSIFRKDVVERVGGFRSAFDGSQDYDLVLRVTEITDRIAHIAKPVYSWRRVPGSTAANADAKKFATKAAKRALKDALKRRGHTGDVEDGIIEGRYRVRYGINGDQKVVIVIPTRNRLDMLHRCIDSIHKKTTYANYEILVVDNDSDDPETLAYLDKSSFRVLPYPGEFNFAAINNAAARAASDADAILFLNNDTEVITPGWLESMLEHAQRSEVAAVGARLFYPDGTVQHEGIIIGLAGGSAGNVDHGGYFGLGETVRNCSAVTAACMMVRPQAFWDVDGFDEQLRVAFNDVDFCLRARKKGYQIVYTPHAQLYHFESASRGNLHPAEDEQLFRDRYGNPGEYYDPYYNPNFDILRPFTLRV
ncbi:MAG: glycosyltransferase [Chloroflexi bacterium]|nr:glycosyltransferase [Chloroflexota bacterium]